MPFSTVTSLIVAKCWWRPLCNFHKFHCSQLILPCVCTLLLSSPSSNLQYFPLIENHFIHCVIALLGLRSVGRLFGLCAHCALYCEIHSEMWHATHNNIQIERLFMCQCCCYWLSDLHTKKTAVATTVLCRQHHIIVYIFARVHTK